MTRKVGWLMSLLLSVGVAAGAQDCAAFFDGALTSLRTSCFEQASPGACYGAGPLSLETTDEADDVTFEAAGDEIGLALIDTLTLAELDPGEQTGGLVRMQVRLNYTDDAITYLLFGDVVVENTGEVTESVPSVLAPVASSQGLNIRALPSADADLLTTAFTGDPVRLTGLTESSEWARVTLEDGGVGWAAASAFNDADLTDLATVEPRDERAYGPMQAFTLTTDNDDTGCAGLPPSGVLVQAPAGDEAAAIQVNDIPVRLFPESTVFLSTTEDDGVLRVDVLEGEADLTTTTAPLIAEAGNSVTFREGELPIPRTYDYDVMGLLPLEDLPRPSFAALDFAALIQRPRENVDPLEGITSEDTCTIAAVLQAANLRQSPDPDARVRHVMQVGESAVPDGRGPGVDGALWWRLTADVWVSSTAVAAVGNCGTLPVLTE